MRFAICTLFVDDQDQALRFFTDQVGFELYEDNRMGDLRWLLVRAPGDSGVALSLALARTSEDRALVGKQGGSAPLFGIVTDDCERDYLAMKTRGVDFEGMPKTMPFGTGVAFRDLYGNRFYLNEEA